MKITNVLVNKKDKENSRLKGFADVTIDDSFIVHNIRIIEGDNGLFIAMPSHKDGKGDFRDICHPLNQNTRNVFTEAILEKYEEMKNNE